MKYSIEKDPDISDSLVGQLEIGDYFQVYLNNKERICQICDDNPDSNLTQCRTIEGSNVVLMNDQPVLSMAACLIEFGTEFPDEVEIA